VGNLGEVFRHAALTSCCALLASVSLQAAELAEPITISSQNGVMDLLMVAKPSPIKTLPNEPTGWVYEICKRPANKSDNCPIKVGDPNYYGGTLLQLQPGDLLKIHLVNQLPMVLDSEHASEPGHEFLALNPTNIHTHGMLVAPRQATTSNPTWGDSVFVLTFNSANGTPTVTPHMHSAVRYNYTDYEIPIPRNHPSGLFWFHPHAHGLSLNQITAGMAGIITVGKPDDYLCTEADCVHNLPNVGIRHLILKDTQILPNNVLQDEEDSGFCPGLPATSGEVRQGKCDGDDTTEDGGPDYTGGSWYFTVNGQVYPNMTVKAPAGEIWRITNASGSATYNLDLWNPAQNREMVMQVLSVDGVSVSRPAGVSGDLKAAGANKFVAEPCPAYMTGHGSDSPLCTRLLHMMPSSRIEVWVTYRDNKDHVSAPPANASAIFRTTGYQTGPSGDYWPAVNLASVAFAKGASQVMNALTVRGEAQKLTSPRLLSSEMLAHNKSVGVDNTCKPLPPGHMRRIFYAVPTTDLDAFGLAVEEVDERGNVVGPMATDVTPFDPMEPTVCVPLGPNNTPVTERWQLVNVATEDHNFHIHQTKFHVLTSDELAGTSLPRVLNGTGVMLDNVPLAHANGTCGNNPPDDNSNPIADWRAGLCKTTPVVVEIPFAIAGDFVYHCHILEHEDGGMMARIRVRATN
jgi:FtsP/CotA-like multicopper oxidase with cupredoxin domain